MPTQALPSLSLAGAWASFLIGICLIKQREVTAHVRFRRGATTGLTLPRPLTAQQLRTTHEDVRRELDALLDQYTAARVALILNERGRRTGAGEAFDGTSVRWVRTSAKLKSLKERLLAAGWLTRRQIQEKLGIRRTTLGRMRRAGTLKARICNEIGEWLCWPPDSPLPDGDPPVPRVATCGKGSSPVRGAV